MTETVVLPIVKLVLALGFFILGKIKKRKHWKPEYVLSEVSLLIKSL